MSKDIRSTPSLTPPTSPGSIKATLARGVLDMNSARRSRPALRMADKRQRDSAGTAAVADFAGAGRLDRQAQRKVDFDISNCDRRYCSTICFRRKLTWPKRQRRQRLQSAPKKRPPVPGDARRVQHRCDLL